MLFILKTAKNNDNFEIQFNTDKEVKIFNTMDEVKQHVSNVVEVVFGSNVSDYVKEVYQKYVELDLNLIGVEDPSYKDIAMLADYGMLIDDFNMDAF